jgi:hypothetical protein
MTEAQQQISTARLHIVGNVLSVFNAVVADVQATMISLLSTA